MLLYRRAILWFSKDTVYILKGIRNWRFSVVSCLFDAHRIRAGTGQASGIREKGFRELSEIYGLQQYRVSIVVGGGKLIYKQTILPTASKKKAKESVFWDNTLLDQSEDLAIDIYRAGKVSGQDAYRWIIGAYPLSEIRMLAEGANAYTAGLEEIDILPTLAARIFSACEGTVYLPEGNGCHVFAVNSGAVEAYEWQGERPLLPTDDMPSATAVLKKDGRWQEAVVKTTGGKVMKQWEIPYLGAFLFEKL